METKQKKTNTAKKPAVKKVASKKVAPSTTDLKAPVYTTLGKEAGTVNLPADIFGARWNSDLVNQVVVSMQANARTPVAHAKDRAEVSGGGKKPWRQKGTGRARHGSNRSPIWVGGGVTHGPKNLRNFSKQINKKMKTVALFSVLSKKLEDGQIVFLDEVTMAEPKTALAKKIVLALNKIRGSKTLGGRKTNAFFVAMPTPAVTIKKSFQNLGNVEVEDIRNINVVDVLKYNTVVFVNPDESIKSLLAKHA
jgi:large subunit ribosomal protein L4